MAEESRANTSSSRSSMDARRCLELSQPLVSCSPAPSSPQQRLDRFAESGEPVRLYAAAHRRATTGREAPSAPLLYVPSQPARTLARDL